MSHIRIVLLLGLVAVTSAPISVRPEDGETFLKDESEILLAARPGKWQKVFLRRTLHDSKIVAYQWEYHLGGRDRRGQGAFTQSIECFLHAPAENVEITVVSPNEMNLKFSFHGQGIDKDSEIRVAAIQNESMSSVSFEGSGELFEEFTERLREIQKEGDDPTQELQWEIMIEPSEK